MATSGSSFSLSQNLTGTAPSASTEGQSIQDFDAVTLVVETATPASQTLSGSGSLRCYIYDTFIAGWSRLPANDVTITVSGVNRQAFSPFAVIGPRASRVLWVPYGVTVSAGTTVTVYQLGFETGGRGVYR